MERKYKDLLRDYKDILVVQLECVHTVVNDIVLSLVRYLGLGDFSINDLLNHVSNYLITSYSQESSTIEVHVGEVYGYVADVGKIEENGIARNVYRVWFNFKEINLEGNEYENLVRELYNISEEDLKGNKYCEYYRDVLEGWLDYKISYSNYSNGVSYLWSMT